MLKKYLHISVCELFEGKAFYFHVQSVFSESYCSQMGCLDFFFLFPYKSTHQIQTLNFQYTNTSERVHESS